VRIRQGTVATERAKSRDAAVTMKIVCLGWGSLIWDPRGLELFGDPPIWHEDGPMLPVEFARQSKDGRITLVVVPGSKRVKVLWCEMKSKDVLSARESLLQREGIGPIGAWPFRRPSRSVATVPYYDRIRRWGKKRGIDAAVWTAIPPKFDDINGRVPSADQVVDYLQRLPQEQLRRAEQYVRLTPQQIRTPYRAYIETALGWSFDPRWPKGLDAS
jgi:hypothetical protein